MKKTYKEIVTNQKDATTIQEEKLKLDYKKYINELKASIAISETRIEKIILGKQEDSNSRPIYAFIGMDSHNTFGSILQHRKDILEATQNLDRAQILYKELFPEE